MSNDLDHYQRGVHGLDHHGLSIEPNNDIAPYSPGTLAPAPDFGTGEPAPQVLDNFSRQYTGGGQVVFGQTLPPGVTIEKMTEAFTQLGSVFVSDFLKLGHDITRSQKAAQWLINAVANPPKQQQQRHSYNLYEHTNDPIFQAFANYAHDNKFPAKFVQDAAWWVTEAAKRLNAQQTNSQPEGSRTEGSAPNSGKPDDLDTATYNALYDYNEKMRPRTEGILRDQWGNAYEANRRMVDNYLKSLSAEEKQHFDRFLNNGLHALNDPTVILGLWGQAVGGNNIPKGGAALADEINMMHDVMKNHRKAWLADERMQSRYRELIRIRDGG